jgi:hypothetical protein
MENQGVVDVRHREALAHALEQFLRLGGEIDGLGNCSRRDEFDDRQGPVQPSACTSSIGPVWRGEVVGQRSAGHFFSRYDPAGKSKRNCKRDSWRHPYILFSLSGGRQFIPRHARDHLVERLDCKWMIIEQTIWPKSVAAAPGMRASLRSKQKSPVVTGLSCWAGGVDGTRTRDPRRDRPVF